MPRPPAVIPNRHLHTTLPADLMTRVELLLYSEAEGMVPRGAMQSFIIERIREFFGTRRIDISPYLNALPGTHFIQGNDHTLSLVIDHLKGKRDDTGTPE